MEIMNAFSSVSHTDNNEDLPIVANEMSQQEMLDYMVLSLVRELSIHPAFKGGWMFNQLIKTESQRTSDIDFSIASTEEYEKIKDLLKKVADCFKQSGLINSYKIKDVIGETVSGGIDMYDLEGRKCLCVDVGLHDISWGIQEYKFNIAELNGFEIERMLADKTIAILSRKRFRRTKDLYDYYIIAGHFDFNFQKLMEYIDIRGGAEWDNIPFNEEVLREYGKAWDKLILQDLNGRQLKRPDFSSVIEMFYSIAIPLKNCEAYNRWNHNSLMLED